MNPRPILLAAFLLPGTSGALAAVTSLQGYVTCNPTKGLKMPTAESEDKACIPVDTQTVAKVCKVRDTDPKDSGAARVEYYDRSGAVVTSWPTRNFVGEIRDFEIFEQRDKENKVTALLVASRWAESNGIGIQAWHVASMDIASKTLSEVIQVEDFGDGSLARPRNETRCQLLNTHFKSVGKGNYWTASLLQVEGTQWKPVPGTREISIRYTRKLEKLRLQTAVSLSRGGRYTPLTWFMK